MTKPTITTSQTVPPISIILLSLLSLFSSFGTEIYSPSKFLVISRSDNSISYYKIMIFSGVLRIRLILDSESWQTIVNIPF